MTTDTALLVSKEILEDKKNFEDLKFVVDPEIPTDDSVSRYVDLKFPFSKIRDELKLSQEDNDLSALRSELVKIGDIKNFENVMSTKKIESDVEREEYTWMEGFRYRVDDSVYPNY
jgi:hypothetical protein